MSTTTENPYSPEILFKLFAEMKEKTDADQKEIVAAQQEIAAAQKKTDEQMKLTDEQMKRTDEKLKNMGIHLDGITKTQGLDAEEFFLSSLQKNPRLGNIKFDIVSTQGEKKLGADKYQMDIFLENGNSVGIVEVKTKAKMDHLDQLDALVKNFNTFYTTHSEMKKYGALAAKIMPKNVEEEALKRGYYVLKQQGNHIEVSNPS